MKQFKRIIDRTGRPRYYIDGKQVNAKRGASEYIKRNFDQVKPENLSKQEKITFLNKQRAIKAASTIRKQSEQRMRFKGRFLNKGLQNLLDLFKFLPPGQRNINREYPDIRDYGELLQEIQRMYKKNLEKGISLDETEWITPNLKRKRTEFENITDIVESLQNDFPSYKLNVITPEGTKITNYVKAVEAVMKWERSKIEQFAKEISKLAYVKFTHFGSIDIFNETVTIDLNRSTAEPRQS
jgi:hypothetical protein